VALNSLTDLARMAAELPEELRRAQVRGVQKGALLVTRAIRAEIREATGGDNRLSGVGRRGARVGARYDVKGQVNPTAIVYATGPLHLIEHDTEPHDIQARNRRRGGTSTMRFADGRFSRTAEHPGTTGSRPFEKGYLKTRDKTGPAFDREVQAAIRKALA
jgi:hypothetical protein